MKGKILLFGMCLFFISCVEKIQTEIEVINVDLDHVEKSSLFLEYDFVALETTNDALLENVVKANIIEDDIFLLSSYGGDIYHFTNKGKFIRKWPRGNGPGELISPTDFFIDKDNKTITILDLYRTFKTYSFNGELLSEKKIDNPFFLFKICNNDTLLFDSNLNKKSSWYLSVFNQEKEFTFLLKKENFKRVGFMPSNVFVEKDSTNLFISHMLSDTIYNYSIDSHTIKPVYLVDMGKKTINNVSDINFENGREFDKTLKDGKYISGISGVSCWNNELFFIVYYQQNFYYVKYDMFKKEVRLYEKLSGDLPNSKRYVNRDAKSLTCMYTMTELKNMSLKNKVLENIVKNATDDDNPVLVVFDVLRN